MEHKTRINDTKKAAVESLKEEFSNYDGYIFADYRGLSVEEITKIRGELREIGSKLKVVKNNYAKLAMRNFSDKLDSEFVGPTAIAYVKGDKGNEVAKILFNASKETQKISLKAGFISNEYYDKQKLELISNLPSKNALISSLMGTMKAPVQKLAATLKAYQEKLASAS